MYDTLLRAANDFLAEVTFNYSPERLWDTFRQLIPVFKFEKIKAKRDNNLKHHITFVQQYISV